MNGLLIGAMLALGTMQQTDTTFAVDGAERLQVETLGGSITIDVWDRAEVRIQAEHSSRTFVDIDRRRGVIDIEAEARRGPANMVDFHITVPRTMALDLEGMYADITVEDSDGAVEAWTRVAKILQDVTRRENIKRESLLLQARGWGLIVARPDELYDRQFGALLKRTREKLRTVDDGGEPAVAETFEEMGVSASMPEIGDGRP